MASTSEIPTEAGHPFSERVTLQGIAYTLQFNWNNVAKCWAVDFYAEDGITQVLLGVPLVTGSDLLEQFGYMALGAQAILTVMSIGPFVSPDMVPDFRSLGDDGHLYMTVP